MESAVIWHVYKQELHKHGGYRQPQLIDAWFDERKADDQVRKLASEKWLTWKAPVTVWW